MFSYILSISAICVAFSPFSLSLSHFRILTRKGKDTGTHFLSLSLSLFLVILINFEGISDEKLHKKDLTKIDILEILKRPNFCFFLQKRYGENT